MQVTEEKNEGLQREFKITLDAKEIDERIENRLREVGKNQHIPGFRPGKAPMSILKQRFGQAVKGEVLERAVQESSQEVLESRGLRPAGQPNIAIESFEDGQDLEYRMSMELLPDIEPMDFSQLSVTTYKIQVPDHELDEAMQRLAEHQKESSPVEEARPAKQGDVLVIDFKGEVDGETLPGMEAEDQYIELGAERFIPGFEEQLEGAQPGEERTVEVTFPEQYQNPQLAGRKAQFHVTVKELREPQPVEIDDAFAEKFGEEGLDALKDRVRSQIRQDYENVTRQRTKRQLLDQLSEGHTFPVPPSMVDSEFEQIWQQIEHDRAQGQLDAEDQNKSEEQLKADYQRIAERRVRLGLLLSEVGRRQNVEVTQDELNNALIQEVQRYPGREREVFEYYQNNQDALQNLRAPIYEDKVIDYILELAQCEERELTTDELRQELEQEQGEQDSAEAGTKSEAAESGADESGSGGGASGKQASGGKSSGGSKASGSKSGSSKSGGAKSSGGKSGGSKSGSKAASSSKSGSAAAGEGEGSDDSAAGGSETAESS